MDLQSEIQQWVANLKTPAPRECHCVGPQNGEPLCPCAMKARGLFRRDGRWIEPEFDHGPVRGS